MTSFDAAFDWARRHVAAGRLPSAIVGVATTEGVVALDALGEVAGRPASVDDRYRLFSITKVLVGIAAARAIERGLLTLQTPLSAALPDFGHARDDVVRLCHLVSHTSGITECPLDATRPLRDELLLAGRDFAAGTVSRYSTLAYEGIAALLEDVTGQAWAETVIEWAAPIGATGLSLDDENAAEIVDAAAAGLSIDRFRELRSPGAGLVSRAEDLLLLGTELLRLSAGSRSTVLSPRTLQMMRRPLFPDVPRLDPYAAERGQDWGFTWNLRTRSPGLIDQDAFGHGGWSGTEFWVHPSAGAAYVLLTNRAIRARVDADELDNAVIGSL
ncbi:MAG: serine hydrolase domain-containing protein [Microbacterium sp.]|uniref:serine hydrolase domain-containing protein n=1 Tax=Microbacterium sp. TaxID=51671 RepID=UPI0039E6C2E4